MDVHLFIQLITGVVFATAAGLKFWSFANRAKEAGNVQGLRKVAVVLLIVGAIGSFVGSCCDIRIPGQGETSAHRVAKASPTRRRTSPPADKLTSTGVTLVFLQENLTYTPAGRSPTSDLMLNLLGAFAEFERSLIWERQADGIALPKTRGVYKRPHTDPHHPGPS